MVGIASVFSIGVLARAQFLELRLVSMGHAQPVCASARLPVVRGSAVRLGGWRVLRASARIAAAGVRLGHLSVVRLTLTVRCLHIGVTPCALAVHLAATPRLL